MNKILVVGIVASGKTTFTTKLSKTFDINYYELDNIAHNSEIEGRPKRTHKEQMDIIRNIDLNGYLKEYIENLIENYIICLILLFI